MRYTILSIFPDQERLYHVVGKVHDTRRFVFTFIFGIICVLYTTIIAIQGRSGHRDENTTSSTTRRMN